MRCRLRDLSAGGRNEFRVGVGGGSRNQVGELTHNRELLVTVECAGVGKDLHPDVITVADDVREGMRGEIVDERRGVVPEHGDVRNTFDFHQSGGQITRQGSGIRKRPARGIHVDHGH